MHFEEKYEDVLQNLESGKMFAFFENSCLNGSINEQGKNQVMNDRIVSNPKILGGKPCVSGTRIPVYMVLELVENGTSFEEIRSKFYPQLVEEDIKACITYARQIIQNEEVNIVLEQAA
jgi:uncharacterized protein (DUF433 family)